MDKSLADLYNQWCVTDSYFQDLAVFSLGPLHPGGIDASRELISLRTWKNCRVLDIGCGNGTTMKIIDSMGGVTLGVEPSPFMREAAKQQGIAEDRLIPKDIESLKLRRDTFDVIIIEGVIGFIEKPLPYIKAMLKHLRPKGEIIICDWMPHNRKSAPDYSFHIYSSFDPIIDISNLSKCNITHKLSRHPVKARAFAINEEEAVRRALLFFKNANKDDLIGIIQRKLNKMRSALPSDIDTERYILQISNSPTPKATS